MKLNLTRLKFPNRYIYFDWWGMPQVIKNLMSWKDCLGRLILMWIAYGMPDELEEAIESCLRASKKKWMLVRHPNTWLKTSRDHWSYFIIYRKLKTQKYLEMEMDFEDIWFKDFVADIPYMRGINIWVNALLGKKKALSLYYWWSIFGAHLRNRWNRFIRTIAMIYPERSNEWWIEKHPQYDYSNGHHLQIHLSWFQKRIRKLLVPTYPLHNKGWQLFVLPDDPRKERLKRILRKPVGHSNLMLRLLLGDLDIAESEVLDYPEMKGYRPGIPLNEACNRDIEELPEGDNQYEKVLLLWLFYYLKRKQFREIKDGQAKVDFLTEHKWLGREMARAYRKS